MIRSRQSIIYLIIFILTDLSMASSDAWSDKKVTKLFEINWESMIYHKTVTQYNPEVLSSRQTSSSSEQLTLSCKIEIKDTKLVLGLSRKGFLTAMTDSEKRAIEINQQEPESRGSHMPPMDMWYEGLQYHMQFTQPPAVPKWKALLFKYLRIPQKPFRPKLVNQLEPPHIRFDLDLGLLDTSGGKKRL